jgi:hydrogenase expression/formation protein HypE
MFLPRFSNPALEVLHDGAVLSMDGGRLAFTTDSYVVQPIFFPGGDIGKLAVNGTVNDLAMCGAKPMYLSAAFILEEGLPMDDLWRVVLSMEESAKKAGVMLVTGDTKVVEHGKGDGMFLTTSGIGCIPNDVNVSPKRALPGDKVIVSGMVGLHGMAILSVREGLEFGTHIESDTAPLNGLVEEMLNTGVDVHVLRDPTRGGLASTLNEVAEASGAGIVLEERSIPVPEEVRGACEMLGLDPLYVANEGNLIAVVPAEGVEALVSTMKKHPAGEATAVIGEVVADHPRMVVLQTQAGGNRVVDMLSGEQLPRIC